MNDLKSHLRITIQTLLGKGVGQREIERITGVVSQDNPPLRAGDPRRNGYEPPEPREVWAAWDEGPVRVVTIGSVGGPQVLIDGKLASRERLSAPRARFVRSARRPSIEFGGLDQVSLQIDDSGNEREIWHDFKDTRHHTVTYYATATSRFANYFPAAMKGLDIEVTRKSEELQPKGFTIDVPSSKRPDVPKILYMVPTFLHEVSTGQSSVALARRTGLRVWLERPWFSSGNQEKLAVVCYPDSFFGKCGSVGADVSPPRVNRWALEDVPEAVRPYVTQLGLDPSLPQGDLVEVIPTGAFSNCASTANGISLAEFADSAKPYSVSIAVHDVEVSKFDVQRQAYMVDIDIDLSNLAWRRSHMALQPFLSLALARYQPYALRGAELSPVVCANITQLQPDRLLTVLRGAKLHEVEVVLTGFGDTEAGCYVPDILGDITYIVRLQLLIRCKTHPGWALVDEHGAIVEEYGNGFAARTIFCLPGDDIDAQFAVRVFEAIRRRVPDPQDPDLVPMGHDFVEQCVGFALLPLSFNSGLSDQTHRPAAVTQRPPSARVEE